MLYSAIHQMRQSEKRLFRLEINKLKKGSDYSKVFDYMSNTKFYDEQRFKKYIKRNEINSANTTVSYLFDKLISFLTTHRPPSVRHLKARYEIEKIAAESETMYQLGFVRQAHRARKKAFELALKHEQQDMAAYNLLFLFFTEYQNTEIKNIVLNKETAEVDLRELIKLWGVKMELQLIGIKQVTLANDINTTEENWKPIIENPILNLDLSEQKFSIKALILSIKYSYHAWKLEPEKAIQYFEELVETYNESEAGFVNFFENLIVFYTNFFEFLYQMKYSELDYYILRLEQEFDKFKKLATNVSSEKMDSVSLYLRLTLSLGRLFSLLLQESFTSKEVNEWSWENTIGNTKDLWVNPVLVSAYMYLIMKSYERFEQCKNMLQENLWLHSTSYLEQELEILSLIAIYETNSAMYFQNQLRNTIRRNKYKNKKSRTVAYMLRLLDKLRKTESPKTILETALPEITTIESTRYAFLHFSTWIKWRLRE